MASLNPLFKKRFRWDEIAVEGFLSLCAFLSIFTTAGIIFILASESIHFFSNVSILSFLTGTQWTPLFDPPKFGILPLLCGTLMIGIGSALIAGPLGILTALFLSEYANDSIRSFLKPALEILAGIPTVVYGYFAITFVTPALRKIFPSVEVFNAASAAIVVAIMILPMIASLSDDAMRSVPKALRYAAFALGATKAEVSTRIVLPASLSGIMASLVLAFSRAIGETMAVTLAAGARPNLTWNPLESIQTMTAYIAQISLGDTPAGTIEYQTIFAVGLSLFVVTFTMNIFAQKLLARFREQYE